MPSTSSSPPRWGNLLVWLLLSCLAGYATATETAAPTIYTATSGGFKYLGCYNETTGIAGTVGNRALYGGSNQVLPGEMTVQKCQDFCKKSDSNYKYAGLEYARECWCAISLSSLSEKFPDTACNLACEGDVTQVCGGNLKLTVYIARAASSIQITWAAVLVSLGAAITLNLR
ncbi:WSC domain-containing protein [Podospora didyma]|uniref:WSC domain-containing protein n=1 Tax=Podospora didyma TaxID=330526 RepID=A0AAE0U8G4_9PEZI|nr:WSC domain-containing protein [Podospora didyma]